MSGGISQEREMKAGHLLVTYEAFQELTGISISFNDEQTRQLEQGQKVILSEEQLIQILSSIGDFEKIWKFLESTASLIPPIVMSLYVMNEALWKLMERNPWDKTKMLAMSTFPFCYWNLGEESATNPKAVKRWEIGENLIKLQRNPLKLSLMGEGGDFSGFIERSQLTMRRFGMIDGRGLVPNYQYKTLSVDISLDEAELELHPTPLDNLDYDFSEKAQTFHDHGFLLRVDGKQVRLAIDKKESTMIGNALILVGAPVDSTDTTHRGPLVDIWFWLFSKIVQRS